jgi:CubicO group peptidase (beta-lactamase class C family)
MSQLAFSRRAMLGSLAGAAFAAGAPARGRERLPEYGSVQGLLDGYVAAGRVPGAVVAIVRPGSSAGRFTSQFLMSGKTAFDGGVPVTPDTLWRVYSMTKPITAMAVMQQVAAGALKLDQPIADILPEFKAMRVLLAPEKGLESRAAERPITVRHLLTHTSGLSYSIIANGPLEKEYRRLGLLPGIGSLGRGSGDGPEPDLQGLLTGLASLPLHSEPGTGWRYSVALDVAGGLLERLTQKRFDAVLSEQLFKPLGMNNTGFSIAAGQLPRLSSNYAWMKPDLTLLDKPVLIDGPGRSDWLGPQKLLAGGAGLLSSARDYARFGQMLLDDGLFEGKRVMQRGVARAAMSNLMPAGVFYDRSLGFGAGGRVTLFDTRSAGDGTPAGTYGWGGAAGTLFQVDPVRQMAVVVMLQYLPQQRFPMPREFQVAINRDLGSQA